MVTRALSSATAGLAVTMALLYAMQWLIASGEEILTDPPAMHFLDWIDPPEPPDSPVEPTPPERIDPPMPTPPTPPRGQPGVDSIGVGIPLPPPAPPTGRPAFKGIGSNDSPLVAMIRSKPIYPLAAAERGIEGTVLVQFDVTQLGTVENVVVLESSNRIFNREAIKAAYRSKYKPRVLDGVPYPAKGLRLLFTFEMPK